MGELARKKADEEAHKKADELARTQVAKQDGAKTQKRDRTDVEAEAKSQTQRIARPQTSKERCRECGEAGLLICRRCNKAKYCSRDCQRKNWPIHKRFCGKTDKDMNELWNNL